MEIFQGFPEGSLSRTAIPDAFFSELLPLIDDIAELKVTLYVIWLLHRKKSEPRWLSYSELANDGALLSALTCIAEPRLALRQGLRKAVERGTLLVVRGQNANGGESWCLLNSPEGRKTIDRIQRGELAPPEADFTLEVRPKPAKPNIFVLYEQNVGPLQPIIAEELEEAARQYPAEWVEEAFHIAAEHNVRNWRYIRAILERWHYQGKDIQSDHRENDRKRFISGEYEEYRRL